MYAKGYNSDWFHCDFDTIPGARIRTLIHAFVSQYINIHWPMDFLIIIGLNDLLWGSSIADIMRQLATFRDIVLAVAPGTRLGPSTRIDAAGGRTPIHALERIDLQQQAASVGQEAADHGKGLPGLLRGHLQSQGYKASQEVRRRICPPGRNITKCLQRIFLLLILFRCFWCFNILWYFWYLWYFCSIHSYTQHRSHHWYLCLKWIRDT